MIEKLLSYIAPHHCCSCDKIGCIICDSCKYNIADDTKNICISCGHLAGANGICDVCKVPYERAWLVGDRSGALQRLIGLYKFERVKEAYRPLADLLASVLPDLPADVVIVPLPTVSGHIRQRGYDHTLLIAKRVALLKGLKCQQLLVRKTNTKQRQASAKQRYKQAKNAFAVNGAVNAGTIYLLIDDVVTTGASIRYATKALRGAGANHVWVAIIAKQLLTF